MWLGETTSEVPQSSNSTHLLLVDHIVPKLEGVTPRGYRFILTITNLFSGYVVAVPCKTKESEETIRLIMHNWVLRFGYPKQLLADNDPSFTSKLFTNVRQHQSSNGLTRG